MYFNVYKREPYSVLYYKWAEHAIPVLISSSVQPFNYYAYIIIMRITYSKT